MRASTLDRFVKKVSFDGCWNWKASKDNDGYGNFWFKSKIYLAHRASYEMFVGSIQDGMTLDHICRNRSCVNPNHLRQMSLKENILCGDGVCAKKLKQTHCVRGHELSGYNLMNRVRNGNVNRSCRICKNERKREREKNISLL